MRILRVALDVPVDDLFDYLGTDEETVPAGRLVVVPFGPRRLVGVVVETAATTQIPTARLRAPLRILGHLPALPPDILSLLRFCSRYYHHPLGQSVLACLPTALRRPAATAAKAPVAFRLTPAGTALEVDALPVRATRKRALLAAFRRAGTLDTRAIAGLVAAGHRLTREFEDAGWIERTSPEVAHAPRSAELSTSGSGPALTDAQAQALESIRSVGPGYSCSLLHGITGSGKTEVYLHLMADAAAKGRQTLLLVPEINLTPQLEARVAERFGAENVVSLHSGLAEGERLARWLRAVRGDASIVLGTRLAVFTPMPSLGLLIVDEEHDASFKQQEGLRYHARDVAVFRAREHAIPVVLGSATPSLESWRHASTGRYRLLTLPKRPTGTEPSLRIVPSGDTAADDALSPTLAEAVDAALARGEQSLLFLNRRGYAPTLFCHACGWAAACSRCTARLTLHLSARRLKCHYCGHEEQVPAHCPDCGNQALLPIGQGTQRIETVLAERFPGARIARVDRDSTRRKGSFARLRDRIQDREIDLLVGTQMLAKGHDFPRVTLVGILGADAALFAPDFRAEERLFSLLLQVAGRAGRADLPGTVIIQTTLPEHPFYRTLLSQDYPAFAVQQLELRRQMSFPPFSHQAVLRADATDEHAVFDFLGDAAAAARRLSNEVTVYDPTPAWIARLAGKWRGQLLLQSVSRRTLHALLRHWLPGLESNRVRWAIDVDPQEP
ncbi:MAG: primosomal protein N' [Betaproteobacteria bacterium]|nr:primosomal protein N' [Betaproteobacteria bacterium]